VQALRSGALRYRQYSRFGVFDRRHETIAASRNGGDVSAARLAFTRRATQCAVIDLEIALLDNGVGPNARCQLVLADQLSRSLDQRREDSPPRGCRDEQQQMSRWMESERAKRLVGGFHSLDAVRRVHLGGRRLR
jgi:hypothetical protein